MEIIQFLQSNIAIALILVGILGLIIGSFLNVIIYRYPIMLKNEWRADCLEFLEKQPEKPPEKINLLYPPSHCPNCKTPIKAWQNIPVISYILLGGKCKYCKKSISLIYPIVEILSALIAIFIIFRFGVTIRALSALILSWGLIVLSFIDLKNLILPDLITLSLLWLGLFVNVFNLFVTPQEAILGAMSGYLFLWVTGKIFLMLRKIEGMGYGDFKMLAMFGAWLGVLPLLNILLVATLLSLFVAGILFLTKKITYTTPIPFGPFLVLGGWLTLLLGPFFVNLIFKFVQ